jgi:hypothetical protein
MHEFGQWLRGLLRHWKVLLAGGGVWLVQFGYSLWKQSMPPIVGLLILLICFFAAAFLGWRDEHRKAKKLQSEIDAHTDSVRMRREEQSELVLDRASELLKHPGPLPFQAMYAARAADLKTNDQVLWVADKLSEHHDHPMQGFGQLVLRSELLDFLRWGKRHAVFEFDKRDDYLQGAVDWAVEHNRGTKANILAQIARELTKNRDDLFLQG